MTPLTLALIFAGIGLLLIVADVFVPSGAVLSVGGVISLLVAVVCCFLVSAKLGAAVGATLIIASPFVIMLMLRIWPHTFIGKRMTLGTVATTSTSPAAIADVPLRPGDRGVAITELRPAGMCEFAGQRVESLSDQGVLPHGTPVHVVSIQNKRPIVRPLSS